MAKKVTTKKQEAKAEPKTILVESLDNVEMAIWTVEYYKDNLVKKANSLANEAKRATEAMWQDIANFQARGTKTSDMKYLVDSIYSEFSRVSHPDILGLITAKGEVEDAEKHLQEMLEAFEWAQINEGHYAGYTIYRH